MESSSPMFERDRAELAGGVSLPPPPRSRDRDGLSALERKALYRVHTELPAMPASLVVQILLWPEKITDWARDENVTPALVYNMLGGFKPYHGLRQRLAERLGVTKGAVDHLIDARRQQPSSRRIPEPPTDFSADDVSLAQRPATVPRPAPRSDAEPSPPDRPVADRHDPNPSQSDTSEQSQADTVESETSVPPDERQISLDF
ncbi:MAG TPA: hypothetical protein VFZ21_01870 [Gemmatimonadaceae bacterium]|jgi:hypothetical protein|nr:hypothetical protein [Gemmatimonadaceae bacterium]